ncbi:MAG: methyltransferase domain-containing protein [Chloroflexi bacterium]|nr:methyltransferase domain-containing protein [Chloroflexota bacterium]
MGGSAEMWRGLGQPLDVSIVNLAHPHGAESCAPWIQGDARFLPFPDGSFDIVFSNSVIEHVGNLDDQRRFAEEIQRVGKRYWVQAPNRYFPVEPHFLFPGFQFLPTPLRVVVAHQWPFSWLKYYGQSAPTIEHEARTVRLPTVREMQKLFPGALVHREVVFGLTKSIIVYSPG